MSKIINIPKHYKRIYESEPFIIEGITIYLPKYVAASIGKYRFNIESDNIFLQRYCNGCKTYYNVQKFDNGEFINIENPFRYIGKASGFHNTCNDCISPQSKKNIATLDNNLVQLNVKIDPDLKRYFQIESIKNKVSLQELITTVLLSYKESK